MNDLVKEIERLNLEIINLQQSREYRIGKKLLHFKSLIKEMSIKKIVDKLKNTRKMERLIKGQFKENRDYNYLKENVNIDTNKNKKILVYTCITGNYDNPSKIYLKENCCDYKLITNNHNLKTNDWEIEYIPEELENKYNNKELNRYYKMHPFIHDEYDYSIYVDGNIDIISTISDLEEFLNKEIGIAMHKHKDNDCVFEEAELCKILKKGNKKEIEKLMKEYSDKNMPHKYGLPECNIIMTDLKNDRANKIYDEWWGKLQKSKCERDQLVFPYILWKNKIKTECIATLGNNVYRNPKFRVNTHVN